MSYPHILVGNKSPVIGGGSDLEATAPDKTSELADKLNDYKSVVFEPGYYAIDADQFDFTAVTGPRQIHGAGFEGYETFLRLNGAGTLLKSGVSGSAFGGFRIIDYISSPPSKLGTGIYLYGARRQRVDDVRYWGLNAGLHMHGDAAYYTSVHGGDANNCASGLLTTDDVQVPPEGPNRGYVQNFLAEGCAIGYDLQGGNSQSFYGCNSAENAVGMRCNVSWLRWFGGFFEENGGNAIELTAEARDVFMSGYSTSDPIVIDPGAVGYVLANAQGSTIRDNGTTLEIAPDSAGSGSIVYKSQLASDTDLKRYLRRRSGAQSWGDGTALKAHLELSGEDLRAKYRLRCESFVAEFEQLTPVSDAITPNLARTKAMDKRVDQLTAALTINNPNMTTWQDGQVCNLWLHGHADTSFGLAWGSAYNVNSTLDSVPPGKAVEVCLKRIGGTIYQIGPAEFVDA